jgi:hypothetical protein
MKKQNWIIAIILLLVILAAVLWCFNRPTSEVDSRPVEKDAGVIYFDSSGADDIPNQLSVDVADLSDTEKDEEIKGQVEIFQLQWTLFALSASLDPMTDTSFSNFLSSASSLETQNNLSLLVDNQDDVYLRAEKDNIIVAVKLSNGKYYCADYETVAKEVSAKPGAMSCN